jgi:hypothetical protein
VRLKRGQMTNLEAWNPGAAVEHVWATKKWAKVYYAYLLFKPSLTIISSSNCFAYYRSFLENKYTSIIEPYSHW